MSQNIEQVVIIGGGSAGWMTAAMLARQLNRSTKITLIESEQIGTIGVGEATIPPIRHFNQLLGIEENDFLARCNGSIKLGIEFENWGRQGDRYMHPFGSFGVDFDYMPFPYFWMKQRLAGDIAELQHFSMAWQLANKNKFMLPDSNLSSLANRHDYAYHFDAGQYVKFLRAYAENLGVVRVEGRVQEVDLEPEAQFIRSVTLQSGQTVDGELFIDCTGQHGILLSKTYGVEFEDWSEYLPNDSAVAVQSGHMSALKPYTRSIAHEAGWQWRIPLQTRMGNGTVYSSLFMSEQAATEQLLQDIDGPPLTEPNPIRFKTGRRKKTWHNNCVAIGLSAGFLEPLESTSLHLIQSAIMRLIRLFPDRACSNLLQDEFNRATANEFESIRDFIILHYKATEREDSDYWRYCKHMAIPDSLQQRLELFKENGHLIIHDKELFKQDNWLAVLIGQGIIPERPAPIMAGKTEVDVVKTFASLEKNMQAIAAQSLSHEMYLAKHCPFKP